jgi:phage shock protein A
MDRRTPEELLQEIKDLREELLLTQQDRTLAEIKVDDLESKMWRFERDVAEKEEECQRLRAAASQTP